MQYSALIRPQVRQLGEGEHLSLVRGFVSKIVGISVTLVCVFTLLASGDAAAEITCPDGFVAEGFDSNDDGVIEDIETACVPDLGDDSTPTTTTPGGTTLTAESFNELINVSSLHRGHSTVLRLYWAVLDREPDVEGALFWLNGYNSGEWPIRRISAYFATSPEFVGKYGAELSNAEFVTVVYRNVLSRDPDVEGYGYWLGAVDAGMAREEMVLLISNAPEFVDSHVLPSDTRTDTGPLG